VKLLYDDLSSEELMPLVAAGDKRAFACLMARHKKTVYGIVSRFFNKQVEADDVFQEVFLRVWRSAASYQPTAKFSTWIYTITVNLCKSELSSFWRRHVRLIASFGSEDGENIVPAAVPSTEDMAASNQEVENIRRAIESLPSQQRLALILSRYEGLSYQEIAEVMQCSLASVESLLFRAKKNLAKSIGNI
jgi:RNA polymerase sigma-70 factor (ECF subfamily)